MRHPRYRAVAACGAAVAVLGRLQPAPRGHRASRATIVRNRGRQPGAWPAACPARAV